LESTRAPNQVTPSTSRSFTAVTFIYELASIAVAFHVSFQSTLFFVFIDIIVDCLTQLSFEFEH
jgi:hypothetical protein